MRSCSQPFRLRDEHHAQGIAPDLAKPTAAAAPGIVALATLVRAAGVDRAAYRRLRAARRRADVCRSPPGRAGYPKRFEQVLAGFVPRTRIRLGLRDGEHQHRPGLDITLSALKSVSLEGLVFGERRVARATLDWIESDLLQTRGYDPAIRCTVHGRSAFGLSTGGGKWLIEGEVLDVRAFLVSVRITACPHDRGLRPGSVVRIPMSELVELDCARRLRDDEDERARIEADIQREIAQREEWVERHVRERDRRRGREHGRDVGWTP